MSHILLYLLLSYLSFRERERERERELYNYNMQQQQLRMYLTFDGQQKTSCEAMRGV
jgi:hypothetical protein